VDSLSAVHTGLLPSVGLPWSSVHPTGQPLSPGRSSAPRLGRLSATRLPRQPLRFAPGSGLRPLTRLRTPRNRQPAGDPRVQIAGDQISRRGTFREGRMRNTAHKTRNLTSPLPWLLRPVDVAELCQVSTKTVLRAIRNGRLRAYRLGARGAYRVRPDDVEAWLRSSLVARRGAPSDRVEEAVQAAPQPRERGRLALDGKVSRK
jgi:excisionase family DNA binding protein